VDPYRSEYDHLTTEIKPEQMNN